MKLSTITLPVTVLSLDFVFPDFLTQFSVYNWILPVATDTPVDDDLDVNLDYNNAMLQDYFEEERAELEALEEAEYFETATILPDTVTDFQANQRRMKRYKDLPNLVPQMTDYNEMDQAWDFTWQVTSTLILTKYPCYIIQRKETTKHARFFTRHEWHKRRDSSHV